MRPAENINELIKKLQLKASILPLKEIPELIGDMQVDGFLRKVAGLLHKRS